MTKSVNHHAPPWLCTGIDGEPPYYVPVELAATREDVPAYLTSVWGVTAEDFKADGMEPVEQIEQVWMAPDPTGEIIDGGEPWKDADEATPGAVRFWRWTW